MLRKFIILTIHFILIIGIAGVSLIFGLNNNQSGQLYPLINSTLDSSAMRQIIYDVRLPRLITGIVAGSLFAGAGSVFQIVYKNHVASPDILGINAAAIFSILVFSAFLPGTQFIMLYSLIGAGIGFGLTGILTGYKTITGATRLIVIGLALSILFRALSQLILIKSNETLHSLTYFLNGSLSNANLDVVKISMLPAIILIGMCFLFTRYLDVMLLSNDIAKTIGVNIAPWQSFYIGLGILMSAVAVSISGSFGFIGLIAPNLARSVSNTSKQRFTLLISLFIGAILTISADLIGRIIVYPDEIPAGLIMIFAGTPVFIYMLKNLKRKH